MVKVSGKKKGAFYLLLVALLLLLGILRGTFASRGRYISYKSRSPQLRFTFLYPRGWKVIEREGKEDEYSQVRILRPGNKKKNIYKYTIVTTVSPVKEEEGEYNGLEEKVSEYKERKQRLFNNFRLLSEKEIILGGQKGKEITVSYRLPILDTSSAKEIVVQSRRVFLQKGSHFYELGYETNERDFLRYSKTFDKLCESFAFKEPLSSEVRARDIKIEEEETQLLATTNVAGENQKGQEEEQETLDVAEAVNPSSVNYTESIVNPEKQVAVGEEALPGWEVEKEEAVKEVEKKGIETLVILNFRDTNLSEVIFYLSQLSGITIALDEKALKGLNNPRVSIYTPKEILLIDALDLILKVKRLDYVIKKNYIWVTKKGQEGEIVTKAYQLKFGVRRIRPVELTFLEEDK